MLTPADLEIKTAAMLETSSDALGAGRVMPLSQAYIPPAGFYDEMFTATAAVRPHCVGAARRLLRMTPEQLAGMRAEAERMLPFDVMPRIIDYDTWTKLEAGLIQRVKALNAFVADVYREGHILKDGLIPRDLILESAQYRRAAVGLTPPLDVFIMIA